MDHAQTISIRGESLLLLPEKLIAWPARQTLLVADIHFGKAATFRHHGIPVPETTNATLERLSSTIEKHRARRVIVLGDLVHSSLKSPGCFEQTLGEWRAANGHLELILLRGNHDRGRDDLFRQLEIQVVPGTLTEGPFVLSHTKTVLADSALYGFSGHVHPQVALSEGKKKLRLPCFWFTDDQAVLPAFGDFTGCAVVKPQPDDRVYVVAEGRVVELSQHAFARGKSGRSR